MDNVNDIEEMRQQINDLKRRLERETTLNEELLHESLKTKMQSVNKMVRRTITCGVVGIASWLIMGEIWHLSIYFTTFTCIFLLTCITAEYKINKLKDNALTTRLTETAAQLIRMKKMRLRQTLIGTLVIILVWGPWLMYELKMHLDAREFIATSIGSVIGGIIGTCIGLRILLKMQRTNDEMIKQINIFNTTY